MSETTIITVEPILPATPIVVANAAFVTTLALVEREVASLKIIDDQSAQSAANLLQRLTAAGAALEKARKAVKEPFIAKGREIDEAARGPAERIEAAKSALKRAQTAWDDAQRAIAAEAERKRLAELARLEALRREEERKERERQAELDRLAAEAAKKEAPIDFDFGDDAPPPPAPAPKTEIQKQIEAVQHAPAVVQQKPAGVRYVVTLIATVADLAAVPEPFVVRSVNMQAVRATFCTKWKEGEPLPVCPGIRFDMKRDVASTGRAVF